MLGVRTKRARLPESRLGPAILSVWLLTCFVVPPIAYTQEDESISILRRMGNAFASVAAKASPGVVGIVAQRTVSRPVSPMREMPFGQPDDSFEDFFDYFFRRSPRERLPERDYTQRAQGSGFIISEKGYILTNNHVVSGADKVLVEVGEGRSVEAEVVGTDPESDVAVIRVDPDEVDGIKPVALGNSDSLQVGEWVLAIGNPMGLSHTVTAGIISATGRSLNIATYENFIQTDAAINMGNSGGPLVNLSGEAVGINTAILGPGGGNIGIGFAIPINMARQVADQLIRTGTVERGYLGVVPQDVTEEIAQALGLEKAEGVVLAEVTPDSPAAQGGLQQGDVVLRFAGTDIDSARQFRNLVAARKPDEKVEVVLRRDSRRRTLSVRLGRRPSVEELRGQRQPTPLQPEVTPQRLGITVQDLTPEMADRFGFQDQTGVIITRVESGSEADEKGLRQGYVIKQVNRRPVNNVQQFEEAVSEAMDDGGRVLLLVTDGRASQYVVLNVPADENR